MRAVIIAAEGVQDVELVYPLYRLDEAGFEVHLSAPECQPFKGINGLPFKPIMGTFFKVTATRWPDVLILPGGVKAMEKLRLNKDVVDYVRDYHQHGRGVIGCICSGAQLMISAGIVRGKRISAYYAMQVDVENAGATFVDEPVVIDDGIVTSPHYKHLGPWMRAVLEETEKAANKRVRG